MESAGGKYGITSDTPRFIDPSIVRGSDKMNDKDLYSRSHRSQTGDGPGEFGSPTRSPNSWAWRHKTKFPMGNVWFPDEVMPNTPEKLSMLARALRFFSRSPMA